MIKYEKSDEKSIIIQKIVNLLKFFVFKKCKIKKKFEGIKKNFDKMEKNN